MTLKEIVTLPYPARISHAIAGVLYYQIKTEDTIIVFPIDMNDRDDVGTTTFLAEYPKPITLTRYIRKAIDSGELVTVTNNAEVSIDRDLRCRICFTVEVEAESEDDAWDKAYDMIDFGDVDVRDCEYCDDSITLVEE